MNETKLGPCPFCNDIWLYVSDGDYYSGYEAHGYRVGCKCGFAWKTIDWCKTEEQAINSWNRKNFLKQRYVKEKNLEGMNYNG